MSFIKNFFDTINHNLFRPNLVISIIVFLQFIISTPPLRNLVLSKSVNLESKWNDYEYDLEIITVYLLFIIFFNFFYLIFKKSFNSINEIKFKKNEFIFFLDIKFYFYFVLVILVSKFILAVFFL